MTMNDQRFDRALPNLFVELASASTPDYLEAAIERASSRPQRPAWTYPGRWLPVQITTQAAPVARMPWRQLGILALIGLLIAVAAVAYVGTRRNPSPAPPFGLAANGAIAMERGGDIVSVDHATSAVTQVTTGPEVDSAPVFFRDGTRIAFERRVDGPGDQRPDHGRQCRWIRLLQATPEPLAGLQWWTVSPDGRDLLVATNAGGASKLTVLAVDGSREPTPIDISLPDDLGRARARELPSARRPRDPRRRQACRLCHARHLRRRRRRPARRSGPSSSPRRIPTYSARPGRRPATPSSTAGSRSSAKGCARCSTSLRADGTGDRQLDAGAGTAYNAAASHWSNDGTRLVVIRGDGDGRASPDRAGDGRRACRSRSRVACRASRAAPTSSTAHLDLVAG